MAYVKDGEIFVDESDYDVLERMVVHLVRQAKSETNGREAANHAERPSVPTAARPLANTPE